MFVGAETVFVDGTTLEEQSHQLDAGLVNRQPGVALDKDGGWEAERTAQPAAGCLASATAHEELQQSTSMHLGEVRFHVPQTLLIPVWCYRANCLLLTLSGTQIGSCIRDSSGSPEAATV